MDVPRLRLQRRQVMGSKPNLTRLARTLSLAALAAPVWAAPHPQIPIWNGTAIETACGGRWSNARAQIAALEKPSPSQAPERVLAPWDRLQILIEDTQGTVAVLTNMSPNPH